MSELHVLPTNTRINFSDPYKNEYARGWVDNDGGKFSDSTVYYIVRKYVDSKKPVFSAIASAGILSDLKSKDNVLLIHDQTGAKMCRAKIEAIVQCVIDPVTGVSHNCISTSNDIFSLDLDLEKSMSLMVFK